MSNKGIIYITQNLVNGKIYVGLHTRGLDDYLGTGKLMLRAIRKYGSDNFRRITVESFDSLEEGQALERLCIKEMGSKAPNGYNLNDGGEGNFGYRYTEEQKKQASESHIGNHNHAGKLASLITRKKMSAAHMGDKNHMWGKKRPDTTARNQVRGTEYAQLRWTRI